MAERQARGVKEEAIGDGCMCDAVESEGKRRDGWMDLSRPTVRVRHGRVSVLRYRGSRLGKGGSRLSGCAISLSLGPS